MLRILFIGILAAASMSANSLYSISIDTSGMNGAVGDLVWDFLSGGGPVNAVSVVGFSSDGTLGDVSTQAISGDVIATGSDPVFIIGGSAVLIDDTVFTEYAIGFTFGSTISFFLDASQNAPGDPSFSPDELSLFFLTPDESASLITTSDPTTANSLLTLDIDGSNDGIPMVYDVSDPSPGVSATMTLQNTVPEPSAWPVLAAVWLVAKFTRRSARAA